MMGKKHKKGKSSGHGGGKKGHKKGTQPKPQVVVPQRKLVDLDSVLQRIYVKEDLGTTCLRQCGCCRVACPQMKFCEASNIIDHVWSTWSREDKRALLVTAVTYYFSDSLIKPCPLLKGNECSVYDKRPMNCRLYGLWPKEDWDRRVQAFSQSTGLPREKLPLNFQCDKVRRNQQPCKTCQGSGKVYDDQTPPGTFVPINCGTCGGLGKITPPPLTGEQIEALFKSLDQADKLIGVSDVKISASWNYRPFHDWVLLKFWGEGVLVKWTNVILTTTPEERKLIVDAFVEQAEKIL